MSIWTPPSLILVQVYECPPLLILSSMLLALAALIMKDTSWSKLGTTITAGWAVQAAFITFLLSS